MGRLFIKDDIISLGAEVVLLGLTTLSTMLWSLWHSGIGIEHIDRAEGTLAILPNPSFANTKDRQEQPYIILA